jgi:hypothetical protein
MGTIVEQGVSVVIRKASDAIPLKTSPQDSRLHHFVLMPTVRPHFFGEEGATRSAPLGYPLRAPHHRLPNAAILPRRVHAHASE